MVYEYLKPTGDISQASMSAGSAMPLYQALSYSFDIENDFQIAYLNPINPSGAGDYTAMYPPLSSVPQKLSLVLRAKHDTATSGFARPSIGEINLWTADMSSLLATGTYNFDMRKQAGGYDTYYRNYEVPLSTIPAASSVITWTTQQLALELVDVNHPLEIRSLDIVASPVQNLDTEAMTLYTVSNRLTCSALNTSDGTIDLQTKSVNNYLEHGRWQGDKYDWTGTLDYTGIFSKAFYQNLGGKNHSERSVVGDVGPTGLAVGIPSPGNISYIPFSEWKSRGTITTDDNTTNELALRNIQANVSLTGDFSVYLFRPPTDEQYLYSNYFTTRPTSNGTGKTATAYIYSQSTSGVDWMMELGTYTPLYAVDPLFASPVAYGLFREHVFIPSGGGDTYQTNYFETILEDEEDHHQLTWTHPFFNHCEMVARYKHGSGVEVYRMSYSGAIREFGWSNNRVVGANPTIFFKGPTRVGVVDGFITNEQINAINANSYFLDASLNDLTADNPLSSSGTYIKTVVPSGNSFQPPILGDGLYLYNLFVEHLPYFLHNTPFDGEITSVASFEYIADVYTEATGVFFRPEIWGCIGEDVGNLNYGIGVWLTEGKKITPGSIQRLSFTGYIGRGSGTPEDPATFLNNMTQENRDNALRTMGSCNLVYGQRESTPKEVRVYSSAIHVCGYTNPVPTGTSIPLYTYGVAGSSTGSIDLFIKGAYLAESGCTLFIRNYESSSGMLPLYIVGGTESGSLPLFIRGESYPASGAMSLFLNATAKTGVYSFTTLFVGGSPFVTGCMNLYVVGQEMGATAGSLNLFLNAEGRESSSLDLFLKNEVSGVTNSMTLYCNAPSGTDGAVPFSGYMPLFIARTTEALANAIPLLISGPTGVAAGVPLYIDSRVESGVDLYINGIGQQTDSVRLYTHGF